MIYLASLTEEIQDKIAGYKIIKTKEELDVVVTDDRENNKVIIRDNFAKEYFTPTGLIRYIKNVNYINRNLSIELQTSENITSKGFINKLRKTKDIDMMLELLNSYPKEFIDTIQYLTSVDYSARRELVSASNKVSRLQAIIDSKNAEIEDLTHAVSVEQYNKLNVQARLDTLIKRINYQYNANVNESTMFSVDTNKYVKVVYIKEITRVQYVDSLIYYLKEILKILYNMPTRMLVIEGYDANGKVRLYPQLSPQHTLTERDVLTGDILMLGMQPKLMSDILQNPSRVAVLIVLDRAGYNEPHIKGNNVEYFYTVSDLKDIPESIPRSRVISYSNETLYIPMISGFDELDEGEKITKYSSTRIVKDIVALIEGRCINGSKGQDKATESEE